jgi:hypothetical protein
MISNDALPAQDLWKALGLDPGRIAGAVQRQLAVLYGEEGYCPIICSAELTPAQEALLPPLAPLDEEFFLAPRPPAKPVALSAIARADLA